jgi:hypothetical protein
MNLSLRKNGKIEHTRTPIEDITTETDEKSSGSVKLIVRRAINSNQRRPTNNR